MSFLTPKVEAPAGLANNTPGRSATLSPSEVYPLVRGRGRVVARPITPVLHWHFRNSERSSYAFFTCLYGLCLGPVDEFAQLIVNGKAYNGIFKHRDENPGDFVTHVISKETPERFWLGWGTEDQGNQTELIQSVIRDDAHPMKTKAHPNRKGIAWLLVQDMEAGSSVGGTTPPLPKIEVELHCRGVATYSFGHAPQGAHPIGTIRDILTLKRGCLGLPGDYFDAAHWTAQTNKLYDSGLAGITGTDLWTSHVLDKPRSASDVIADVASYFDGHIRERDGKLQVDWQPNDGSTSSPTGLREISLHEMADEPSLEPDDLEQLATQVIVTGLDWEADPPLSEASEVAQVPYSRRLIGEARPVQLNRPGWCARTQIKSAATIEAASRANPSLKVRVAVLRQYAVQPDGITPLRPGDRFTLDWAPIGLDVVVRILERSKETATRVEFYVQVERGAFPRPYEPALDPRASIDPPLPADLTRYTAAQIPPALSTVPAVTILAERPSTAAEGMEIHFSPTDSWPGQILARSARWAVGALLGAALPNDADDVTVQVGSTGVDWLYLSSQSALQQGDDTLLLYHDGEWCSVGTITPTGGGNYDVVLKRARLGSAAKEHASGALAFFIHRSQLVRLEHSNFLAIQSGGEYDETTATKWFKLRPYNSAGTGTLTAAFSLVLRNWWGETPLIELGSVPSSPKVGIPYPITGEILDLTGDLVRFSVTIAKIVDGEIDSEITVLARDVVGWETTLVEFKVYAIFPVAGNWRVIIRAWDAAGNIGEAETDVVAVAENTTISDLEDLVDEVMEQMEVLTLEANQLATDLLAEVAAREEAIIDEATAREDADASITTALDAVTADYNGNKATVAAQISAITSVNSAQATDISALYSSVGSANASISSVSTALSSETSTRSSQVTSLQSQINGVDSVVDILSAAYIVGGVAIATWGFKLDAYGKVVGMQAIAAAGGSQADTGVIVFSGADLRSDNYSAGSSGWIIRADGSVEFASGTFRGGLQIGTGSTIPGYSGDTSTGLSVEPGSVALFISRDDVFALSLNRNGSDGDVAIFHKYASQVGSIRVTGSATSYITSSDRRMKANIEDAEVDIGALIDQVRVREYEFLAEPGQRRLGVIAQELYEVFPDAVARGDDYETPLPGGTWGVDHSKLVIPLLLEVQSLRSRVAALEGAA